MKSLFLLAILCTLFISIHGSSHSEAPGSSNLPGTDATDMYMFQSYEPGRTGYTTFIANYNPRHPPFGGPNYYALDPNFYYNIFVDNTGEGTYDMNFQFQIINELAAGGRGIALLVGKDQVVYQPLKAVGPIVAGDNSNLNFLEYYRLNVINLQGASGLVTDVATGSTTLKKAYDNPGTKTFPNYPAYAAQYYYTISIPGCSGTGRVFVGQRAEPFSINLGKIFDLVNFVPIDGAPPSNFPGGIINNKANNVIRWLNIVSFILEVPTTCVVGSGNGVIGSWTATRSIVGNRQKSRMGNALVNELLIGLPDKDKWNRRKPTQDGLLNRYIAFPTFPAIINALFLAPVNAALKVNLANLAPTNFPRTDLQAIFLTGLKGVNQLRDPPNGGYVEYLRLNTSIPPTPQGNQSFLGVIGGDNAGYPNGRRPGDDVIDITLRAAMGALCYTKLGYCTSAQAPIGNAALIDGSPISANDFANAFPYLNSPTPGSLAIN